jgi:hypothetical protein
VRLRPLGHLSKRSWLDFPTFAVVRLQLAADEFPRLFAPPSAFPMRCTPPINQIVEEHLDLNVFERRYRVLSCT